MPYHGATPSSFPVTPIGSGTAVLGALRRHPAVLAQEAATLARLSGRRVILGMGVGARRQDVALGIWRHVDADYGA